MYTWIPLSSRADLVQLAKHISGEYAPENVAKRLADGMSDAVKGVLIERNYVDKDYRSTYYNFYSKKGQHYRADCVRLHFFDQTVKFDEKALKLGCPDNRLPDHYFGYMVLRPTGIATIGRSIVSPDVRSGANRFIITRGSQSPSPRLQVNRAGISFDGSAHRHFSLRTCSLLVDSSTLQRTLQCLSGISHSRHHVDGPAIQPWGSRSVQGTGGVACRAGFPGSRDVSLSRPARKERQR